MILISMIYTVLEFDSKLHQPLWRWDNETWLGQKYNTELQDPCKYNILRGLFAQKRFLFTFTIGGWLWQ